MEQPAPLDDRAKDFALAALAAGHPSAESVGTLALLRHELSSHAGLGPWLARSEHGLDALGTDHVECFDVGGGHVPLYETEYGRSRGLSKGRDLADVVGFYRAFGFALAEDGGSEMPDHLAVELEFYALLLHKQQLLRDDAEGSDIVADARRAFLRDHLGSFAAAVARQPPVAAHAVFGPLLRWCAELVAAECASLGVTPAPLDFFPAKHADDEVRCGACVIEGEGRSS
ncbi:MAG: hypothetical protein A2138_19270 [Deltaproteobacteria bacterium RBG_16_71_12]|nr:MAG: hypothetical protein A2138_19270 [Deltaproteobacteria bacterium RBG_16_71_12]HJW75618.1 molecular chaperone TorD family protein [Thermoleophilia bacterium]